MTWTFSCSGCGQEIAVNDPMREAMLARGCPVCGDAIEAAQFE